MRSADTRSDGRSGHSQRTATHVLRGLDDINHDDTSSVFRLVYVVMERHLQDLDRTDLEL